MALNWKSLISPALSLLSPLLVSVVAGRGAKLQGIASSAVRSAVTTVDNGLEQLDQAFDKFSAANPVVSAAISEFSILAKSAGLSLPEETVVISHIKAAIFDLATILVPAAQMGGTTPDMAPGTAPVSAAPSAVGG